MHVNAVVITTANSMPARWWKRTERNWRSGDSHSSCDYSKRYASQVVEDREELDEWRWHYYPTMLLITT